MIIPLAWEIKTSKQRKVIPNPKKEKKRSERIYTKSLSKMKQHPNFKCGNGGCDSLYDKGLAFKREEAKEQFALGRAQNVKDIWNYLQILSNFVIPLDTNLRHSLNTSCMKTKD